MKDFLFLSCSISFRLPAIFGGEQSKQEGFLPSVMIVSVFQL